MPQPPRNNRTTAVLNTVHLHPEVDYWRHEWEMIRDAVLGEKAIKDKAETYLPKLDSMTAEEYRAFLDRGVFFNMTGRTVTGLVGKLFRRPPVLTGLPDRLTEGTKTITKDGQSLHMLANTVAREVFTMGRYGVLLDMDPTGAKPPYLTGYLAENIVDWQTSTLDGREVLTEVVLREIRLEDRPPTASGLRLASARRYFASYRVLRLEPESETNLRMIYRQYVFTQDGANASISAVPSEVYTPTFRGRPFEFIPFMFFGPQTNLPEIEKSPINDIVRLNISHYRSYAQLEHGRFYTALPVFYVPVKANQEKAEYTIGPSVVWLVDEGQKPGLLEFNGQGLKFLENALTTKEAQAAALGGRLMGVTQESTAESDNAVKIKEANEQALLLNVAQTLSDGISKLLRWWAMWQDVDDAEQSGMTYEVSRDFIFDQMAAREFRAIHAMYKDGVIPIEVVYDYLRRAEVIPDWLDMEEFKELLDKSESFPGQVDILAKQKGMPNAQTEVDLEEAEKDREHERDLERLRGMQRQSARPAGQSE